MDEHDYYKAFGIEQPQEEPTTETESTETTQADTTQDDTNKSESQPEPTETGETKLNGEDIPPEGEDGTEDETEGETEEPVEQTPEQRHRAAEYRRQQQETARQQAEQARIDEIYADMFKGQTDPFTGKPIRTEAEFKAYQSAKEKKEQEDALKAAGLQPDLIAGIVKQQVEPLQQQLEQEQIAKAQRAAADAQRRAQEHINASMQKITADMPEVKTLTDIAALPTAGRFNQLVRSGVTLEDAFYLANRTEIERGKLQRSQQATINQVRSKSHLQQTGGNDGGIKSVPPDIVEQCRAFCPGISDEEILKEYNNTMKGV